MFDEFDKAVARIIRLTKDPEFTSNNLKQLAESGAINVCFRHRGTIGLFQFPAKTLPPTPDKLFYFDGYLRSLTRPRLDSQITIAGKLVRMDVLNPVAVSIVEVVLMDPILAQPFADPSPNYWGLVLDEIRMVIRDKKNLPARTHVQPALLLCATIPAKDWLFERGELDSYIKSVQQLERQTEVLPIPVTVAVSMPPGKPPKQLTRKIPHFLHSLINEALTKCADPPDIADLMDNLRAIVQNKIVAKDKHFLNLFTGGFKYMDAHDEEHNYTIKKLKAYVNGDNIN